MPIHKAIGGNPNFATVTRARILKVLVTLISMVFIAQLAYLQIVHGTDFMLESETQAIKKVVIEPFRGKMFDRNNKLVVHNEPSFSVTLTPNDFKLESLPLLLSILPVDTVDIINTFTFIYRKKTYENKIYPKICELIDIDKEKIKKRGVRNKHYSRFSPIKIYRDAEFSELSLIEEYSDYLPGIDIVVESKRLYDFEATMGHILGYSREISKAELNKYKYYRRGDIIGKRGIEKEYESMLRGQQGVQFVAVNAAGRKISAFDGGQRDIQSKNGDDLYLSIDIRLQEIAERELKGYRGAVVGIDPNTGEIMVLASKPDFDPREFTGKISSEYYSALYSNKDKPMYNRAVQAKKPPGSTWKMLVAIAALEEGIINEHSTIPCSGGFTFGGRRFGCHGAHGNADVVRALQGSCNVFFYQLGLKLGLDKIEKYARMFGFGSQTGIDLPSENPGNMPSMEWLKKNKYTGGFTRGKLLNYGIGQGEIDVTPLQLAAYTAAIANGGTFNQPHLVKAIHNNITDKVEPIQYDKRKLPISQKTFDLIFEGMYRVVNMPGGTAGRARVSGVDVCGKTGTAQNPHGKDHAWFTCFAPRENPQIAMAVYVENAGFGGTVAAPIAQKILDAYFHPEKTMDSTNVQPNYRDSLDFEEIEVVTPIVEENSNTEATEEEEVSIINQ